MLHYSICGYKYISVYVGVKATRMDAHRLAGTCLDMGSQQGKHFAQAMRGGLESVMVIV